MAAFTNGSFVSEPKECPAAPASDEEVCRRVLAGNTPLYEVLMRRHNQALYRAVRSILRDELEVEDAMQETYLSAWTHLPGFLGTAKFSTWLLRIGVHEALARARRGRRIEPQGQVPPRAGEMAGPSNDNPEERAVVRQLSGLLEEAIDELPDLYRTVFVLRDLEGLSTSEVALVLELNEDAVKTRLSRGRAMLRRALYQRVGPQAPEVFEFRALRCDRVVAWVLGRIGSSAAGPA
jgi:RNA polymerase sigma-70 factor (ECF subfamily)